MNCFFVCWTFKIASGNCVNFLSITVLTLWVAPPKMFYNWYRIWWSRNQLWNCTQFRHPTDERLRQLDIFRSRTPDLGLSSSNYPYHHGNTGLSQWLFYEEKSSFYTENFSIAIQRHDSLAPSRTNVTGSRGRCAVFLARHLNLTVPLHASVWLVTGGFMLGGGRVRGGNLAIN